MVRLSSVIETVHRKRLLVVALAVGGALCACSPYHGPVTNAPEGYHEVGLPTGG